ncbi:hypothetical protein NQZ68_018770 [Dissostichus eleginoides]|nr:hypothetical protein NQZ68_018770 [Dissostichus eleginoides]
MVRLVFRPYTQVGRPICTSGPLRASTRVSSGFALPRHIHHLSGPIARAHAPPPRIVTPRRDSDLEAFSHNPTDGSFAPLAPQPSTYTKCLNLRFLSY